MTTSIIVDIYIPRILGKIPIENIYETFERLGIGKVTYLDTRNRVNEKGNSYYFAFLSLELYESDTSTIFYNSLTKWGKTKVLYDSMNMLKYWEVQRYMAKDKRRISEQSPVKKSQVGFTDMDKKEMVREYEEIQKEIFNMMYYPVITEEDREEMDREYEELEREIYQEVNKTKIPIESMILSCVSGNKLGTKTRELTESEILILLEASEGNP